LRFIKRYWREAAGAVVVLLTRLYSLPRTPWELDEFHFIAGVRDFDPSKYHPHPPGYPLFIALGKLFNLVTHDPFFALVAVSVVSCVIGFLALAAAFRHYIDDESAAVAAALLFYLSAGMLVHSPLALTDAATLMFLALAFAAMSRFPEEGTDRRAMLVGVWCAAAIGVRPQICIPLLPAFIAALWLMRDRSDAEAHSKFRNRRALIALGALAFVCLMWFLPLMDAAGGPAGLQAYELKQAQYFAEHDAALSRGALGYGAIVARFIAHPWGSKYVALPLLLFAAIGLPAFVRGFRKGSLPLVIFCAVHILFALVAMDPADGVRYALPSMTIFALLASLGAASIGRTVQLPGVPWLFAAILGAGSWIYVSPIVKLRTGGPSPVAQAAAFANAHYGPDTVIAYDLALREQTAWLMPRFAAQPIDVALSKYYDAAETPMVLFADGGSKAAEAKVFAWPGSDAYGKLTRNKYLEVTLDPIRPAERYLPVHGVYANERTNAGEEWRWLAREAVIRLPHDHPDRLVLTLKLSSDAPYAADHVRVVSGGVELAAADVGRGAATKLPVILGAKANPDLHIISSDAFMPATVLHNQDPRQLAVQLVAVDRD
jgi:hypothetical protein